MRKKAGFTLIELLVVVAIIAVLISILMPSLKKARELAKRAVCSSNQHGITLAANIYATDFNGRVRVGGFDWWPNWIQHDGEVNNDKARVNLSVYYPDYFTSGEVLRCPSDNDGIYMHDGATFSETWKAIGDYPSSGWFGGSTTDGFIRGSYNVWSVRDDALGHPAIRFPDRRIDELDTFVVDFWYLSNASGAEPRMFHSSGWNAGYIDGSVRFVSRSAFEAKYMELYGWAYDWKYCYDALWDRYDGFGGPTWDTFDEF